MRTKPRRETPREGVCAFTWKEREKDVEASKMKYSPASSSAPFISTIYLHHSYKLGRDRRKADGCTGKTKPSFYGAFHQKEEM